MIKIATRKLFTGYVVSENIKATPKLKSQSCHLGETSEVQHWNNSDTAPSLPQCRQTDHEFCHVKMHLVSSRATTVFSASTSPSPLRCVVVFCRSLRLIDADFFWRDVDDGLVLTSFEPRRDVIIDAGWLLDRCCLPLFWAIDTFLEAGRLFASIFAPWFENLRSSKAE